MTTSDKTSDNGWYEWQQKAAIDKEWQQVTRNDNEWYNEWQRMTTSDHFGYFFFFFQIREEPTTKHPGKYSYEIPCDYYKGEGTSWEN